MSEVSVRYQLAFFNGVGVHLGTTEAFISLEYAKRENYVTMLSTFFAGDFFDAREAWLDAGNLVLLYASVNDGAFELQENTVWVLLDTFPQWDGAGETIELLLYDGKWIVRSRIVAYAAGSAQADKSGEIDAIGKAVIRENFGSSATDSERDISAYFEVAGDLTGATDVVDYAFSYDVMGHFLDTLFGASWSKGTLWLYEVEPVLSNGNISKLRFWTAIGLLGVARDLVFAPEAGNVSAYKIHNIYSDEFNAIYAGGSGTGASRLVRSSVDSVRSKRTPYARRELFLSRPQLGSNAELDDVAASELASGVPLRTIEIDLAETPGSIYGVDWRFGDSVRYQIKRLNGTRRVSLITVKVERGRRTIKAFLTDTAPIAEKLAAISPADVQI